MAGRLIGICLLFLLYFAGAVPGSLSAPPAHPRIVSLAPSDTELVYSVGASKLLVGVCNQCDYPEACKSVPVVGTFVNVNIEKLAGRTPDAVLLVSGQEALSGLLEHNRFHAVVLDNSKLSGISKNLKTLGRLTGNEARGDRLANTFDQCLRQLQQIIQQSKTHPRLFYCVWPDPLLTAGRNSFLNDVITECGGINIAAELPAPYPHFSLEKLLIQQPDIIIFPHESQGQPFLGKPPWSSLKAIKNGNVFFLPPAADDHLARPTLRIIEGLYWLSVRLHPELSAQLARWIKDSHCRFAPLP